MQQSHQPRPLNSKRSGEFGLRQPTIGTDDHQHRELRRADIDRCERADEILENPHLKPPDEVTEVIVERVEGYGTRTAPRWSPAAQCQRLAPRMAIAGHAASVARSDRGIRY